MKGAEKGMEGMRGTGQTKEGNLERDNTRKYRFGFVCS